MSDPTPSQTVGPFLSIGLPWDDGPDVVPAGTPGAILLHGRLLDGAGEPVPDGLIETWQAGPDGRFGGAFRGFGRAATAEDGSWAIRTLKPAAVDGAPYVAVSVFARGLLDRVVTRMYFADEPEANATDPLLQAIDDPARRGTLIAEPDGDGYRFDIHLQGERETVFLDV